MLLDYAEDHFRREEEMMAEVSFPGLDGHRLADRDLKERVEELHVRYQRGEQRPEDEDLWLEILAFLSTWLHFHIKEQDIAFRNFIVRKRY